jgi:trk system potassium uptake protein TrkH
MPLMSPRTIGWLLGLVLTLVAATVSLPLAVALGLGEPWSPFAGALAVGLGLGTALLVALRHEDKSLDHRSGFFAVTAAWLTVCAFGALPFLFHPLLDLGVVDALFESVSGFTTTGATVLSGLDTLPRSVLLWRSLTQWLGGMGMVLLGVAVLPVLGVGGMQLYRAETPGLTKDKITPRIAETAKLLWMLYVGLSVVEATLLYLSGMSLFDAVCHTMTTISTGGFSTHDASLSGYESGFTHGVVTLFMMLGGCSFAILHRTLTRGIAWSESPELRFYVGVFALGALLIAVDLRMSLPERFPTGAEALQHAAFQAATILTTTGFVSQDYDTWPQLSHAVLFALLFVGGMAGSTGGGIKVVRVMLMIRFAFSQFFRLVHPHGFYAMRLGERTVEEAVIQSVAGFLGMWTILLGAGTVLIALHGTDLLTSLSAAAVTLGNIGPGFSGVGPSHTYDAFAPTAKLTFVVLMILGRLEVYTVLVILTPGFWRR